MANKLHIKWCKSQSIYNYLKLFDVHDLLLKNIESREILMRFVLSRNRENFI